MWELDHKESWALKNWCFWTVVWRRLLRVPWTERRSNRSILKEISPEIHWKGWCWSWNSNTLATWCEELTHWKRLWCWEGLGARGEGDDRGWNGWMASLTRWTWVSVNSGSWCWTGRPVVLRFMGSQRVGHNWVTELNWTRTYHIAHETLINVTSWPGWKGSWEKMDTCVCMAGSLHCSPETVTTLFVIQLFFNTK